MVAPEELRRRQNCRQSHLAQNIYAQACLGTTDTRPFINKEHKSGKKQGHRKKGTASASCTLQAARLPMVHDPDAHTRSAWRRRANHIRALGQRGRAAKS